MNCMSKNFEHKAYVFFIALVILLGFLLTMAISVTIGKAIGDFWFHLEFSKAYANGEMALFEEKFMAPNKGPYPPLFHLLFVPLVKLGIATQSALFLQLIFYPLALLTPVFFMWKKANVGAASFTSVMLFSSIAFFDRSMQVIPQALDMIFFPLALYSFLENKRLPFIVLMFVLVYSHSMYGLISLSLLFIYSLKFKTGSKMVRDAFLISLPMIILTLLFLPSYLGFAIGEAQTPQERYIMQNPLYVIQFTGLIPVSAFMFSVIYMYRTRKPDKIDTLLILWVIILLPILLAYPERFCTIVALPMSMFASKIIMEKFSSYNRWYSLILLSFLFILSLQAYLSWWYVLSGSGPLVFDTSAGIQ